MPPTIALNGGRERQDGDTVDPPAPRAAQRVSGRDGLDEARKGTRPADDKPEADASSDPSNPAESSANIAARNGRTHAGGTHQPKATSGTRTRDLRFTKAPLYQLSQGGVGGRVSPPQPALSTP